MNDAMLLLMNRENMLFDERYCKDFVNGGPKNAFRNNHSLRVKKRRSTMGKKSTLPTVSLVKWFFLLAHERCYVAVDEQKKYGI